MNRKIVSGLVLTTLLVCILTLTFNIHPIESNPGTIIVPDTWETIQDAISHRDDEDIFVRAGIYPENVHVPKEESNLLLKGEDPETTIIDGNGTGTVVNVKADRVTITGFTIRNSGEKYGTGGIILSDCDNCNVTGNLIMNSRDGIYLQRSLNCTISNNLIANNSHSGIRLTGSHVTMMHSNELAENDEGIFMASSNNSVMHGNQITKNAIGIYMGNSFDNKMHDNEVTENDIGIKVSSSYDNTIYHNDFVGNTCQIYDEAWEYPDSTWITNSTNIWDIDYPCGGNYWSDSMHDDTCWGKAQSSHGSDMICDIAYKIYKQNEDRYPFIKPWPMPGFQIFEFGHYSIESTVRPRDVYMLHCVALTNSSIANFDFNSTQEQISFNLITNISDSCRVIVPNHVLDGAFNFLIDDDPAACCIRWAEHEHMIDFTCSHGNFEVKIMGEIAEKPPITEFPDINGDDIITIRDLFIVAKRFGDELED